ncbi:hypothetical protein GN956_G2644 [Arapaima gigas]
MGLPIGPTSKREDGPNVGSQPTLRKAVPTSARVPAAALQGVAPGGESFNQIQGDPCCPAYAQLAFFTAVRCRPRRPPDACCVQRSKITSNDGNQFPDHAAHKPNLRAASSRPKTSTACFIRTFQKRTYKSNPLLFCFKNAGGAVLLEIFLPLSVSFLGADGAPLHQLEAAHPLCSLMSPGDYVTILVAETYTHAVDLP